MSYCPMCGAEVQARDLYCSVCGAAYWLKRDAARAELIARLRAAGDPSAADELAKIDYLLEALEQSQARGEISGHTYSLLARRYLERAHTLGLKPSQAGDAVKVGGLEGPAVAQPTPASEQTPTLPVPAGDADKQAGPAFTPAPSPSSPRPAAVFPVWEPRPPSRVALAARSVPWTVWVALVGALLVVAAAAGFAIYAWPSLAAGARLGILAGATVLIYGGGIWLRRRMAVIGISLLAVGAALILVDGWLAIWPSVWTVCGGGHCCSP